MSSSNASAPDSPNPSRRRAKALLLALLVFALLGGAWYSYYLLVGRFHVSTDNAYVHGDRIPVSAQVSGTVIAVHARDTDRVHQGQVLVELDPSDAQLALDKAQAALALEVRKLRQDYAQVDALQATLEMDRAQLELAQANLARQQRLRRDATNSKEQFQQAQTTEQVAKAKLALDQAKLTGARAAIGPGDLADNPGVKQAAAAVRVAYLALQRTRILAPVDGFIANRGVQVGQQVSPADVLMDVVPLGDVWVEANFKETHLTHVRIGQPAEMHADMYGSSLTYHGRVQGLSPGTGSAFALLPPQNATGNWIKVVQRLPVRIALQADEVKAHPLRVGLSMAVDIDTRERSGASPLAGKPARQADGATAVYANRLAGARELIGRIIAANRGDTADGGN